jgi:hypothetical protein
LLVEGVVTDVWAELQESETAIDAAAMPIAKAFLHTRRLRRTCCKLLATRKWKRFSP